MGVSWISGRAGWEADQGVKEYVLVYIHTATLGPVTAVILHAPVPTSPQDSKGQILTT